MTDPTRSEKDFVNWVENMITLEGNLLGHRDDAVAVTMGEEIMVISIDGWVESTDRPVGMTPRQVGFRAVCNAVSDIIAKGAVPKGMIISSTINEEHKPQLKEIIQGIADASARLDTPFFGGDMNSGKELVIDVTVWGTTQHLIPRGGAEVGDAIFWMGPPLGCTAAALGILSQGWLGNKVQAVQIMGEPILFPEFASYHAKAAIDSSDGLAISLHHLADQSGIAIEIDHFPEPEDWIKQVANSNNLTLEELYLFGGEELGIVFAYDPQRAEMDGLLKHEHCFRLGSVVEGAGVSYQGKEVERRGWDHFETV